MWKLNIIEGNIAFYSFHIWWKCIKIAKKLNESRNSVYETLPNLIKYTQKQLKRTIR